MQQKIEDIVTLDSAIKSTSEILTGKTMYKLIKLSLSYLSNIDDSSDTKPYWRIELVNTMDNSTIISLVDCDSGDDIFYTLSDSISTSTSN